MLARLKSIFYPDGFIPSSAIFPSIDSERLARELRLEEHGRNRGANNQPASNSKEFDHIETGILERLEDLRRKGLQNYATHHRVYYERLTRAGQASKEVEIAAGSARNDFGILVQTWQTRIIAARDRYHDAYKWYLRFREIHRLERPAKQFEGWVKVFSLAIVLIVVEAGINSYLFSKGNEFGLLGGVLAATIVSVVNVGMSSLLGYLARYMHHRNLVLKLFGLLAVLVWIAFAAATNLGVAHFRDGLEAGQLWHDATIQAVPKLAAAPFALSSIESWLLAGIGLLISTLALRKGWHTDDPYPGYGRVERQREEAHRDYESELHDALADLKSRQEEGIGDLRDANDLVRGGISEAIDALFGQVALGAHLKAFLEQCDIKVAHLLAVYRDANRSARNDPAPPSFDRMPKFAPFDQQPADHGRRETAEAEAARVTATVDAAISEIFATFDKARKTFEDARTVQRDGSPEPRTI